MSFNQQIIKKIQEIIPTLPPGWAEIVAQRMEIRREVVWAYANGNRGKRNYEKLKEILRQMKTLQTEFQKEIEKETA